MQVSDYVIAPNVQSELAHHPADAGRPAGFTDRLIWISEGKLRGSPIFISSRGLRDLTRGEGDGGTDVHQHDSAQIYLLMSGQPQLRVEFELDGSSTEVGGPATLYVPAGVPHRISILEGTGSVVAILLQGSYA